jgi:hypothetical protein
MEYVSGDQGRTQHGQGWPRDSAVLLGVLAALLVAFQYKTLAKLSVLGARVRYAGFLHFVRDIRQQVSLDWLDGALGCAIVVAFALLIVLEVWRRSLSSFLEAALDTERRAVIAVALSSLVLVRFYLATGDLVWAGDAPAHISYAWIASRSFSLGEVPIWTNYFGAGSPFLQFYGFLFFYIVGLVSLILRDPYLSVKVAMASGHVLSGVGMYLFVRRLCGSRRAGLVAGLGYVLSFWHTQQVLIMGRLPLSVFYGLLPWPFYFTERLRFAPGRALSVVGGGLSLGLLAFAHPGYAFWATVMLMLYAVVRVIGSGGRLCTRSVIVCTIVLIASGVVFGAYLTLPMLTERSATDLGLGIDHSAFPDPMWQQLLFWSNGRFRLLLPYESREHWYGGYLGISLIALAAVGLVCSAFFRRFRRTGLPILAGLALSLFLVFGYRLPALQSLDVVRALQAGRYLLFVVFFLAAAAGVGAAGLFAIRRQSSPSRILSVLLLILMVDLGATTFQQPYDPQGGGAWDEFMSFSFYSDLKEESDKYEQGELPEYRVFHATGTMHRPLVVSWLVPRTGMPIFGGAYTELPAAHHAFCHPLEKLLNPILEQGGPPAEVPSHLASGAYLLNTKGLIAVIRDEKTEEWECRKWRYQATTPVVFSPRIKGYRYLDGEVPRVPSDEEFLDLIEAIGVDIGTRSCEAILLADYEGEEDLGTSPRTVVSEHRVWNQRMEMRVYVSEPCFARLAYAYYPYLDMTVDGRPAVPLQTAGRFIALRLEAGEHRIVLAPRLSPLRRGLLAVDMGLLIAGAVVVYRARRRRSQSTGRGQVEDHR